MTEENIISGDQMLATTVPNEECLPHLHVITYRKNYALNTLTELPLKKITDNYISEHKESLTGAYQKI